MNILKRKRTSKCTDGAVVYEYLLSDPIDHLFLSLLEESGKMEKKELGDLSLFTFQKDDWLTMKGMSDDTILYLTHMKPQTKDAELFIDTIISIYNEKRSSC